MLCLSEPPTFCSHNGRVLNNKLGEPRKKLDSTIELISKISIGLFFSMYSISLNILSGD